MADARIYKMPKSASQSGYANTQDWILEFAPAAQRRAEPLMGWIAGGDTRAQLRLRFDSEAEAVAYARANNLDYDVAMPHARRIKPKAYADNFRFGRLDPWSH